MNFNEMYDILQLDVGVGQEALDLAFSLNGTNEETACSILFYYTGWRNFEGFLEELRDEDE